MVPAEKDVSGYLANHVYPLALSFLCFFGFRVCVSSQENATPVREPECDVRLQAKGFCGEKIHPKRKKSLQRGRTFCDQTLDKCQAWVGGAMPLSNSHAVQEKLCALSAPRKQVLRAARGHQCQHNTHLYLPIVACQLRFVPHGDSFNRNSGSLFRGSSIWGRRPMVAGGQGCQVFCA